MSPVQIILMLLLCAAAVTTDLRSRKIPNKITVPFALAGMIWQTYQFGWTGAKSSLLGFFVGFLIFLIPYALKGMGAGDVKLMAALGALSNWQFILYTALLTAVMGGLIVLISRIIQGGFVTLLKNVGSMLIYGLLWLISKIYPSPKISGLMARFHVELSREASNYIPYALAIALGTVSCLVLLWTGRISAG